MTNLLFYIDIAMDILLMSVLIWVVHRVEKMLNPTISKKDLVERLNRSKQ